jgi:uncharacterized protein (TIGR03437 family)
MLLSALAVGVVAPPLHGQSLNQVRVFTNPPGISFRVDDSLVTNVGSFLWPAGSKHTITFNEGDQRDPGTRFIYQGWASNLSSERSFTQLITASPELRWVRLDLELEYRFSITFEPPVPGRVEVVKPGSCEGTFTQDFSCWVKAGEQVDVRAYPGSGAVFTRWISGTGVPGPASSFILAFLMTRAVSLTPEFGPAAGSSTNVTLQTDPQELTVIVDGVRYTPPVKFEWGWNSTHRLAVEPNQNSRGVAYVFHSWSDGGDASHDIRVPSPSGPIEVVAHFVPAHTVRFSTSPPNLKLTVDFRQDWPNYAFAWLPGSVHRVTAPPTQTDPNGRRYRFVSWSNGQPASFDYSAGPPAGDIQVVATYQPLGQATITSTPTGLPLEIDGAPCATPCVVERDIGESIRVAAATVLNATQRARLVFRGWTDTNRETRVIQLSADPKTYLANYVQQSRLSVTVAPPEGALIRTDPTSGDGFYDTGVVVALTAAPSLGFRVQSWSGDLRGSAMNASIILDAPKDIYLLLDRVPAVGPSGVRSAAAANLEELAPGSLISIFGANLAPVFAIAQANPLPQTLQGVTVRVEDTLLPLTFVSPGQINAQLPAATPLGTNHVTVRWEGYPETSIVVKVSRNAPGLFASGAPDEPLGIFVRPDGEPITTERPARPGDTVTVLGTGLGPYDPEPPDGFILESSVYRLIDPVRVMVGDVDIDPLFAGKSGAGVGVDAVRFRMPLDLPSSKTIAVKITVNGRESNTVLLPVAR